VVVVVIVLSMIPVVVELWKARRRAPAVKP
jgi:hypothetical protein